jgi:hypothetical protein
MASDDNPYSPPQSQAPLPEERTPRKLVSFEAALELFVIVVIVMTLVSLIAPFIPN